MKPELVDHFRRVRDTVTEVDRFVALHKYPDDTRTVMVMGLLTATIQHHRSILMLITSGSVRSAIALIKDIVDGMYSGLWVNACATPEQIHSIKTEGKTPVHLPEIVKAVDAAYKGDTFFEDVRKRWGAPLHKANRAGILQLGRWALDPDVGLEPNERELSEVTTTATACVLVLASAFLAKQNYPVEARAVEALGKE
jgi:hypothetical protein